MSDDIKAEARRLCDFMGGWSDAVPSTRYHEEASSPCRDCAEIAAALRRQREASAADAKEAWDRAHAVGFPHWCRDGHDRVGFSGDSEICPACEAYQRGLADGARQEREALAKVAEECYHRDCHHGQEIAEAIRARGEKPSE